VDDAHLAPGGLLVGLHEALQHILRRDALFHHAEGLRTEGRVRVGLRRDRADPRLGEWDHGADRDESRLDRDAEIFRLRIESDDAEGRWDRRAHEADWDARGYGDVVDELDARHLQEMFERMGIPPATGDPLHLSRELEREALAGVNARFPDARTAIERLRRMGHRVYVATGGSETNEAALRGAGLSGRIDGIFSGHSQGVHKRRPAYSAEVPRTIGSRPSDCV